MSQGKDKTRFNTEKMPNWCPGCGNFGLQNALKKTLLELDLEPHQVCVVSGIGCSGKIPHWVNVYALHGLHGRTLPAAAGIKLANHNLVVLAEGGDGDGYSEGMCHFIHAVRRNIDMTYIVHNNGVFALTTGQASSTGEQGRKTISTPEGAIEPPFRPAALAIAAGVTFVARGYSGDTEQLKDLYVEAIKHRGFSFVDVMQVCVTYNPEKNYAWYKERVYKLEEEGHDPADRDRALALALDQDGNGRLATGIFYRTERPAYEDAIPQIAETPLVEQDISNVDIRALMEALT